MIQGKLKEELNEFELEIQMLLGSLHERTGYIYYFELLHETFTRSAKHLILDSQQFKKDLLSEDRENSQSLIQSNESVSNPLIQTLYNSYFITVHSELEIMLSKVNDIMDDHFNNSTFPKKTNRGCFSSFIDESKTLSFITETLLQYNILIIYSYIRNALIHPKNFKGSPEFIELEQYIIEKKIINIEIIEFESRFNFQITEIDFIINYSQVVISFLQDLINNSIKYRKLIS